MPFHLLGVVPIVMSAGAAVLPTVLAAAASILMLLFKPRELLRACRRRPVVAGVSASVIALLTGGVCFLVSRTAPARTAVHADKSSNTHFDWAQVAVDLLAQQAAGRTPTVLLAAGDSAGPGAEPATHFPPNPPADPPEGSVSTAHAEAAPTADFSRSLAQGNISPAQLKPLWHFRPDDTMFLAKPVIAGKTIFTAGCQSDLSGYTGLLACIDLDTGKPIWQLTDLNQEPLKPFFSSPALTSDGKYLVIGQGLHQDHDCSLLCFEAATGKLHWAVKSTLHIESSPAIFGDIAVVGAGAIEGADGKPTGDPGYVFAVRISDGKELWRQPVNDPESSPAIDEKGIVYIGSGFNGNAIVALRSESDDELREKKLSRVLWKRPVALPVTGDISLAGDLVIAGSGNGDFVHSQQNAQGMVVAIDKKSGEIRWSTPVSDSVLGSIACRDGMVICPSRSGEVLALSLDAGKILWRKRISGNAPVLAGCAFTGKRIYAVTSDGYLAVLDVKDGNILEKIYLNDQAKPGSGLTGCPPQILNGRVYAGSETGGLQCLMGTGSVE